MGLTVSSARSEYILRSQDLLKRAAGLNTRANTLEWTIHSRNAIFGMMLTTIGLGTRLYPHHQLHGIPVTGISYRIAGRSVVSRNARCGRQPSRAGSAFESPMNVHELPAPVPFVYAVPTCVSIRNRRLDNSSASVGTRILLSVFRVITPEIDGSR